MSEGICMCFYKAIVQSMFKHLASENAPLVLILQSYPQIFIVQILGNSLSVAQKVHAFSKVKLI